MQVNITSKKLLFILFLSPLLLLSIEYNADIETFAKGAHDYFLYDANKLNQFSIDAGSSWNLMAYDDYSIYETGGILLYRPSKQYYTWEREPSGTNEILGNIFLHSLLSMGGQLFLSFEGQVDFDTRTTVDHRYFEGEKNNQRNLSSTFLTTSKAFIDIGYTDRVPSEETDKDSTFFRKNIMLYRTSVGAGIWYYSKNRNGIEKIDSVTRVIKETIQATSPAIRVNLKSNLTETMNLPGLLSISYEKVIGNGNEFDIEAVAYEIHGNNSLAARMVYNTGKWSEGDLDYDWRKLLVDVQYSRKIGMGILIFGGAYYDFWRSTGLYAGFRYSPTEIFKRSFVKSDEIFDHSYYNK